MKRMISQRIRCPRVGGEWVEARYCREGSGPYHQWLTIDAVGCGYEEDLSEEES